MSQKPFCGDGCLHKLITKSGFSTSKTVALRALPMSDAKSRPLTPGMGTRSAMAHGARPDVPTPTATKLKCKVIATMVMLVRDVGSCDGENNDNDGNNSNAGNNVNGYNG